MYGCVPFSHRGEFTSFLQTSIRRRFPAEATFSSRGRRRSKACEDKCSDVSGTTRAWWLESNESRMGHRASTFPWQLRPPPPHSLFPAVYAFVLTRSFHQLSSGTEQFCNAALIAEILLFLRQRSMSLSSWDRGGRCSEN